MKILGIESTQRQGSVALMDHGTVVRELTLGKEARSASLLAPGIRQILNEAGWQSGALERIAVTVGPGSFTGLRVGVTTAKALAYALGIDVIGVNTLAVLAAQAGHDGLVEAIMDAQRNELFCQRFQVAQGQVQPLDEIHIEDDERWCQTLSEDVIITGPVLEKLADGLAPSMQLADRETWIPQAVTVARLGMQQNPTGTAFELVPEYYRKSAAQEKRDSC